MNTSEKLDLAAKLLTVASTFLYLLGYIDVGLYVSMVAAAAAIMSSLLLHAMGRTVKKLAGRKTYRTAKTPDETPTYFGDKVSTVETLEHLLQSLFKIHTSLEQIAEEKIASKTSARDIVALSKARLEVIVKIKDLLIVLEKLRPSSDEKDLSTLLRELVQENTGSRPEQSP